MRSVSAYSSYSGTGHEVENSKTTPPPRLAYAPIVKAGPLNLGDPELEAAYSATTRGLVFRKVARCADPAGGMQIDAGVLLKPGSELTFQADLSPLILDDLLVVLRTRGSGKGKLFVDGLDLKSFTLEENPKQNPPLWGETALRLENRLVEGKELTKFRIQAEGNSQLEIYGIWLLRYGRSRGPDAADLPATPEGSFVQNQNASHGPLVIQDFRFLAGLGMKGSSRTTLALEEGLRSFEAFIGVDAKSQLPGPVVFRILVDGEEKFRSRGMQRGEAPEMAYVSVFGGKTLTLVTECQGEALGNWAEARLSR